MQDYPLLSENAKFGEIVHIVSLQLVYRNWIQKAPMVPSFTTETGNNKRGGSDRVLIHFLFGSAECRYGGVAYSSLHHK